MQLSHNHNDDSESIEVTTNNYQEPQSQVLPAEFYLKAVRQYKSPEQFELELEILWVKLKKRIRSRCSGEVDSLVRDHHSTQVAR